MLVSGERMALGTGGLEARLLAPGAARAAYPLIRLGFPDLTLAAWNRFARAANGMAGRRGGLVSIMDRRGIIHAVFAYALRETLDGGRALAVTELVMGHLPGEALRHALLAALETLGMRSNATCLRIEVAEGTLAMADRAALLAVGFRVQGEHLARACGVVAGLR
jgi:hypothetical protein